MTPTEAINLILNNRLTAAEAFMAACVAKYGDDNLNISKLSRQSGFKRERLSAARQRVLEIATTTKVHDPKTGRPKSNLRKKTGDPIMGHHESSRSAAIIAESLGNLKLEKKCISKRGAPKTGQFLVEQEVSKGSSPSNSPSSKYIGGGSKENALEQDNTCLLKIYNNNTIEGENSGDVTASPFGSFAPVQCDLWGGEHLIDTEKKAKGERPKAAYKPWVPYLMEEWNKNCPKHISKVRVIHITPKFQDAIDACRDKGTWRQAILGLQNSPWLREGKYKSWRMDFLYLIRRAANDPNDLEKWAQEGRAIIKKTSNKPLDISSVAAKLLDETGNRLDVEVVDRYAKEHGFARSRLYSECEGILTGRQEAVNGN